MHGSSITTNNHYAESLIIAKVFSLCEIYQVDCSFSSLRMIIVVDMPNDIYCGSSIHGCGDSLSQMSISNDKFTRSVVNSAFSSCVYRETLRTFVLEDILPLVGDIPNLQATIRKNEKLQKVW